MAGRENSGCRVKCSAGNKIFGRTGVVRVELPTTKKPASSNARTIQRLTPQRQKGFLVVCSTIRVLGGRISLRWFEPAGRLPYQPQGHADAYRDADDDESDRKKRLGAQEPVDP